MSPIETLPRPVRTTSRTKKILRVLIVGIIALGVFYIYVTNRPEEKFNNEIRFYQGTEHTLYKQSFVTFLTWIEHDYRLVSRMELREIIKDIDVSDPAYILYADELEYIIFIDTPIQVPDDTQNLYYPAWRSK